MIDAATLRALSDLAGPERAFLTVYLDAGDDASALDGDLDRVRALLSDQPAEAEHFRESLAVAQKLLAERSAPAGGSLAFYASWAAGLAKAFELPEPVGTRVWMGDAPYVRPVYELLDEHEPYAVAVVDNTSARIYLVGPDEVDEAGRVRGDVKNRVKKGGWSQKRYARRRDKQIETYATEVADGLAALADERSVARLVLVGSDEPVQAVTAALRTDLADILVGSDSVDGNATPEEALEAAAEIAQAGEREDERELWVEIREQGMGPGLAAFGASSVVDALRTHRVEAVLIDRNVELAGTKCRDCETVAHGTPVTCGVCGSSDVFRIDLVEAMTEQAARTGAEVDFADPFPALTEVGGVAALLRYSLSEHDAEQEERERRQLAEQARTEREARGDGAAGGSAGTVLEPASQPEFAPVPEETPEPVHEPTAVAGPVPELESVAEPVPVVEPEPATEPAAGPVAAPTTPRQKTGKKRSPDRQPAADTPARDDRLVQKGLGWGLIALGLFEFVVGAVKLPVIGGAEMLLGSGIAAVGAMNLVPPRSKSVRLALGGVGLLLVIVALVLFVGDHGL